MGILTPKTPKNAPCATWCREGVFVRKYKKLGVLPKMSVHTHISAKNKFARQFWEFQKNRFSDDNGLGTPRPNTGRKPVHAPPGRNTQKRDTLQNSKKIISTPQLFFAQLHPPGTTNQMNMGFTYKTREFSMQQGPTKIGLNANSSISIPHVD